MSCGYASFYVQRQAFTPLLADILFNLSSRQSSLRCIARGGWILNQVEDDGGGALRMTAWKVGGDGLEGWG